MYKGLYRIIQFFLVGCYNRRVVPPEKLNLRDKTSSYRKNTFCGKQKVGRLCRNRVTDSERSAERHRLRTHEHVSLFLRPHDLAARNTASDGSIFSRYGFSHFFGKGSSRINSKTRPAACFFIHSFNRAREGADTLISVCIQIARVKKSEGGSRLFYNRLRRKVCPANDNLTFLFEYSFVFGFLRLARDINILGAFYERPYLRPFEYKMVKPEQGRKTQFFASIDVVADIKGEGSAAFLRCF